MTILVLAAASLAVHLAANATGGYGYFRDELYYIACSKHLAAGYVDQPPLSVFVMAGTRLVVGESVFAIRLVPALASALSVALVCLLARRLGGGTLAMTVGALGFLAAPQLLSFHTFFSMNSLDILLWLLALHALVGVIERRTTRAWLWLGVVLGLGLLNKTSVLWLGAGIGAAIVLTDLRRELARPGPYLAAAVALAMFSPFLIWNHLNDWPHLEFMRNATAGKYSSLTRMRFLVDQVKGMNPFSYLVALPGLWRCLLHREGRRWRPLGFVFLVVLGILLANPHTKSEYAAAAYPVLFACGGVAFELLRRPWRHAAAWGVTVLLVLSGAALAPFAMPILPVESYIRYARAHGVAPATAEAKELSDLPQFFADMHGWEELARNVSGAYLTIPEAERATTVAFVHNYGEAGALELFARRYPLPRVICNHNSYFLWGLGPTPITTFIRLGGAREDYLDTYGDVTPAGVHTCAHCMPYEHDLPIFIARSRRVPIEQAWHEYRHYD
ncbi:MAG: glycosyltransferase family 39 protein [Thermoanaerobaculaceae bacterium]